MTDLYVFVNISDDMALTKKNSFRKELIKKRKTRYQDMFFPFFKLCKVSFEFLNIEKVLAFSWMKGIPKRAI